MPRLLRRIAPVLLTLACLHVGCAQIQQNVQLRAEPLEKPRVSRLESGHGTGVSGQRQGDAVLVQVWQVTYCTEQTRQNARGIEVIERHSVGPSLAMQWTFGGVLTAAAAGLATYNTVVPPDPNTGKSQAAGYVMPAVIGAAGLGMIIGSLVQQMSLGTHEFDRGVRELLVQGRPEPCKRQPATSGHIRLTFSDMSELQADADAQVRATISLPADLDKHLQDSRRVTLEVDGDTRAQERITL